MTTDPTRFPADFTWGVASSAYQIEGAVAEDGRTPSIWDTFSHTPGKTRNGDTGDIAVDHYHRFREDVALMAELGVGAYRFSLSWSRLMPDGVGEVNPGGVAFYRSLCEELLEAGITPIANLFHWDLPQVLQDRGGWLDRGSPEWFARYTAVAKQELGDLVSKWSTFNEPWCSAFLGHGSGDHAPGISDPGSAFLAAHHHMVAHHRAVSALRAADPEDEVGIVLNLIPAWPASDSPADAAAATAADIVQNRQFADAVFRGSYPDEILDAHERFGVADRIDLDELARLHTPIDYLGVNYYNVNHFAAEPGRPAPGEWPLSDEAMLATPPGRLTEMGWGVEPEGLGWMLRRVADEYPEVPVVITENGAAYPDVVEADGVVDDQDRIAYLDSHLGVIADAIADGIDITGYYVWSLLDNFEWSQGYHMRFGLVRVDYGTLERTVKASGWWFRDFVDAARR